VPASHIRHISNDAADVRDVGVLYSELVIIALHRCRRMTTHQERSAIVAAHD
jgi:hypothetical protein